MKTYIDCGINWDWFLEAEIQGEEVFIHSHVRMHRGDERPKTDGSFHLVEKERPYPPQEPRLVVAVRLYNYGDKVWKAYKVKNPKGPFDYSYR